MFVGAPEIAVGQLVGIVVVIQALDYNIRFPQQAHILAHIIAATRALLKHNIFVGRLR
jgi:hypothetical protein